MGNAAAHGEGGEAAAPEEDAGLVPALGKKRDMSLPQLARYCLPIDLETLAREAEAAGKAVKQPHVYVALRGEIFDVSNALDAVTAEYKEFFGKDKVDASESELEHFRATYVCLGKVVEQRIFDVDELAKAKGVDGAPIYIAARGLVFDISSGASFYGPEGGYHLFAGRNAQRALALVSLKMEDVDNTNIEDLEPSHLKVLDDWIDKYYEKYPHIGMLKEAPASAATASAATASEAAPATSSNAAPAEAVADVAADVAAEPAPPAPAAE